MPLNTLRLNHQASSHPNDRIVFIKPLPRPPNDQASYELADTFLRAIAAQCLPIMKKHYLSVTTLEEHEWNKEFVGRNFNNGEIVQLVLRSQSGAWLPFNMVQMVMMHELAHNTHMNHGKYFWQARNEYAGEMKELFAKGYTGEGLWGRGRTLSSDLATALSGNIVRSEELEGLPLCGGTYRSRRRKRKAAGTGQDLTWKEKRDRRIEKKFGKNGVNLGEDEDKRLMLEIGRKGPIGGKPRVAQSKRGRELRAAAALARFDTNKQGGDLVKNEEDTTDSEDYEDGDVGQDDARDVYGRKLLDSKGNSMVRVCEEEDVDDVHVKQEMEDLEIHNDFMHPREPRSTTPTKVEPESGDDTSTVRATPSPPPPSRSLSAQAPTVSEDNQDHQRPTDQQRLSHRQLPQNARKTPAITIRKLGEEGRPPIRNDTVSNITLPSANKGAISVVSAYSTKLAVPSSNPFTGLLPTVDCPVCSMTNNRLNPTCVACAHVLDPKKDPKHWRCSNTTCQGSQYINAGDCGICGVCGGKKRRPSVSMKADH